MNDTIYVRKFHGKLGVVDLTLLEKVTEYKGWDRFNSHTVCMKFDDPMEAAIYMAKLAPRLRGVPFEASLGES